MISLNFYKGVPFSIENNDVLYTTESDFLTFLANYQVGSTTILNDWFDVIGNDERAEIDVDITFNPDELNYLMVSYYDESTVSRKKFFFINTIQHLSESTYRLNLSIDYWQTYFLQRRLTQIEPSLKNALVVQGHGFENGSEISELIKPASCNDTYTFTSLFKGSYGFRIVIHGTTTFNNLYETILISPNLYYVNTAVEEINRIVSNPTLHINNSQSNMTILNIYLVPSPFLFDWPSSSLGDAKFVYNNIDILFKIGNKNSTYSGGASWDISQTYTVTPTKGEITLVGTGATNVELEYNGDSYSVDIHTSISNDFAITMIANKQILNITKDFEINNIYNEYANYMNQSKNTRAVNTISKVVGGVVGLGTGIATGNMAGILGFGASAFSLFSDVAKLQDMQSKPVSVLNDTDSIFNLIMYFSFGVFTFEPINKQSILNFDDYFGFGMNGFNSSLSIGSTTDYNRFRYCKCSEINIVGNFAQIVKTTLENYFKRGIRIWYDKSHFLDSMTPKIEV